MLNSLRTRFIVSFLGLTIIPLILALGLLTWQGSTQQKQVIDQIVLSNQLLSIVTEQPILAALSSVVITGLGMVFIVIGAVSLALVCYNLTVRHVIQPIEDLVKMTQLSSQENLSSQVASSELDEGESELDEIGILAQNIKGMRNQFQQSIEILQYQIQASDISAKINRHIASILDVDRLLQYVIRSIQDSFNFDHIYIYLSNEINSDLRLVAGTGSIGQKLVEQNYSVQINQGLVGRVANQRQGLLINDVRYNSFFQPTKLLSNIRSELAVPLLHGYQLLGVLDIQNHKVDQFNQADLMLMQSIANQLVIAMNNARIFQETQTAVAEAESLTRRLIRDSWRDIRQKTEITSHVFTSSGIETRTSDWLSTMSDVVQQKDGTRSQNQRLVQSSEQVAIPLILRGEMIGVVGIERTNGREWSQDELTTIESVTNQVSLALDSARLAQETERRAAREESIANLTQAVWSAEDVVSILRNAVTELGDTLRASKVVLRLGFDDAAQDH